MVPYIGMDPAKENTTQESLAPSKSPETTDTNHAEQLREIVNEMTRQLETMAATKDRLDGMLKLMEESPVAASTVNESIALTPQAPVEQAAQILANGAAATSPDMSSLAVPTPIVDMVPPTPVVDSPPVVDASQTATTTEQKPQPIKEEEHRGLWDTLFKGKVKVEPVSPPAETQSVDTETTETQTAPVVTVPEPALATTPDTPVISQDAASAAPVVIPEAPTAPQVPTEVPGLSDISQPAQEATQNPAIPVVETVEETPAVPPAPVQTEVTTAPIVEPALAQTPEAPVAPASETNSIPEDTWAKIIQGEEIKPQVDALVASLPGDKEENYNNLMIGIYERYKQNFRDTAQTILNNPTEYAQYLDHARSQMAAIEAIDQSPIDPKDSQGHKTLMTAMSFWRKPQPTA